MRTPHDLTDDDARRLVRQVRRGNARAFGELYDLFFDACVAGARRITHRDEDFCMDVVQDLMMRVADKLPALRSQAALLAWMRRSLYTAAIDRLRAENRLGARERKAARRGEESPRRGPCDQAIRDEELDWLQREVAQLDADEKKLVLSRFADTATLEESGARIGINGDAAHGRLRRILRRLRAAGSAHLEEPR